MNRIKSILIKALLLQALLVLSLGASRAATYYISNSGNDSNTGLTTAQAWKTLNKVNSWIFKPGDQILFQRGSTFYGSLTVKNSGTATNPITYGAYGTGEKPVITGFTAVTSWKNLGNNIWESTDAVSTLETCNMVTVNGVNTAMGRWPNGTQNDGYLNVDSKTATSITSAGLNNSTVKNWAGAQVVTRNGMFTIAKSIVNSQSGTTLNFESVSASTNYGFFIQNDARTLDLQNEWFFNTTTKKIRIYSSAQPSNVKVASVETLVLLNGNYLKFDNISLEGSNNYMVYNWDNKPKWNHISITNSRFYFSGAQFITTLSNHLTIDNCTFNSCNGGALFLTSGYKNAVTNCNIDNVLQFPGMIPNPYYTAAVLNSTSNRLLIQYCNFKNIGYTAISFYGDSTEVRNNFIDTYCNVLDDGGAIYTYTGDRKTTFDNKILNNIIVNAVGAPNGMSPKSSIRGIYLDANSSNIEVAFNTVYKSIFSGIFHRPRKNINVHDNTVFDGGRYSFYSTYGTGGDTLPTGNKLNNNLFIVPRVTDSTNDYSEERCVEYFYSDLKGSLNKSILLNSIEQQDNNSYWRNSIDGKVIRYNGDGTASYSVTLIGWQSVSGKDKNSPKTLAPINKEDDIEIKYNASKEPSIVTIDQPMVDVKGAKYYGKYTLQPYTSVVLLKVAQTPVPTNEYKTICEGSSYNGWTTSGKYELKTVDAKGNYSLVTVNLTVTPVSKLTENITINEGENYKGWTQSGTYTRKLTAVSGCDSLVTTNLVVIKLINKQGEVLPTHYTPAGLNSTGQNPMTLRIEGAELEDSPLTTGDEIAVFSGTTCVGAIRLSHPIQATDASSVATVSVYPRTSTYSGFVSNDTIVFKIWSAQQQKEFTINRVNYKNDLAAWATTGKFSAGSAAVVELFSYTELTQTIYLKQGYNLISAYVAPVNADAAQVLKSLAASGDLSKVQDETGNAYENWGTAGGWVNSIGLMEETEGYKVRVTADCSLKITGRPVALPLDIPLVEGWNLISYPRIDEVNAMSIIQSLIDENKLVKVQDENGSAIENWQSFGGWINGIGNFVPGKAYKVKVNSSAVLHIDENYLKSSVLLAQAALPEHFLKVTEGNGIDHMNINLSGLNESGLQAGDELAAFDGGVCVGSIKITEAQLDNGLAVISASYKTDLAVKDGFTEGNVLQLKVWKQHGNTESVVGVVCTAGRLVYERNASVFVQLKSGALTTAITSLGMQAGWNVFPNPTDGAFTVKFDQMPEEGSRIDILDISGKKITSRVVSWYAEDFDLAGQAPGVYLVKSTHGSNELIRKLIIN